MLNLDCPNCGKPHRVDNAFRGGVARCDSCGALIHVPTKDGKPIEAQGGPKRRPGSPSGITSTPGRKGRKLKTSEAKGARGERRFPGKPVAVTLVILILAISAAAAWVIYQTAMKNGQG